MTEGIEALVAERDTLRAEVERLCLRVEQLSAIEVVPVSEVVDRLIAERDACRAETERLREDNRKLSLLFKALGPVWGCRERR